MNYNFIDYPSDIKSLIHTINLQGEELIGVEVGIFRAESLCTIIQNCKNVKVLYGIDFWKPYSDYLKDPYDGKPAYSISQREIELIRFTAFNNIKYSGFENKITIIEEDSSVAAKKFVDNFFDFVFLDTYMTYEQCCQDLEDWYSKCKNNGIFAGHDWNSTAVQQSLLNFKKKYNISQEISAYDNLWCWRKN